MNTPHILTQGPLRSIYTNGAHLTEAMAAQLDTIPAEQLRPIARVRLQGQQHVIGVHATTGDLCLSRITDTANGLPLAVLY